MQASSYEQSEPEMNEGSLNETANSIHFQNAGRDEEMVSINSILQRFIKEELEVQLKFDNLQENRLIVDLPHIVLEPTPWIYCLPHTILFTRNQNLEHLKEMLQNLEREDYFLSMDRQKKELTVKVHSRSEMCFYNLRCLKTDFRLHRNPCMFDSKYLVDKLYLFYERFYTKIYFKETMVLMLYWAHQRELLEHVISEQALKLLVICIFVNFGYGVNNIVSIEAENPLKQKQWKKMNTYARMNSRGETQIMEELITQFDNYTIQEKRGFYMLNSKRFMQIKDILPIPFPLIPLTEKDDEKYSAQIDRNLKVVTEHETQNMSICKNLSKLFKFLYNKFDKQMKFVVDFAEKVGYRHEFSQSFQLEIIHPVLNTSVCRLKDCRIKNLKQEIVAVYQSFNKSLDPIEIIRTMLQKARP